MYAWVHVTTPTRALQPATAVRRLQALGQDVLRRGVRGLLEHAAPLLAEGRHLHRAQQLRPGQALGFGCMGAGSLAFGHTHGDT